MITEIEMGIDFDSKYCPSLEDVDIQRVLDVVPPPVLRQMQQFGVVLAGGAIRDTVTHDPVKDIDIFCHGKEQAKDLAQSHGVPIKSTFCAYSVTLGTIVVQYIYYKEFTTPLELISVFDFSACGAAIYWGPNQWWKGIALDSFYKDCLDKTLTFRKHPKDLGQLCPLRRALNFAQKGWTVSDETLADIIIHWQKGGQPVNRASEVISLDDNYNSDYRQSLIRKFAPPYGN